MRESDITQPVIDKCKQISEHWRMEIYGGCWVIDEKEVPLLINNSHDVEWVKHRFPHIPIPSISDCLEKLKVMEYAEYSITTFSPYDTEHEIELWKGNTTLNYRGNTLHEALLSALLEVLKNG